MSVLSLVRHGLLALGVCWLTACKFSVLEQQGPREPEFERLGASQSIVFIHGMYLTPDAWGPWQDFFEAQGYTTYAPAWPLHELSVMEQNQQHPSAALGELTLEDVLNRYRNFVLELDEKPIVIGHSMGGLIAQLLLQEGRVSGAVALHSAPPYGVISAEPAFLKANWAMLNPLIPAGEPQQLTLKQFQYGFVNGMDAEQQQAVFERFVVPESRRVGRSTLTRAASLDLAVARGPLLLVAGGEDRTITARLNYANFDAYEATPAITDYRQYPERNHWTLGMAGWEIVAGDVVDWIEQQR